MCCLAFSVVSWTRTFNKNQAFIHAESDRPTTPRSTFLAGRHHFLGITSPPLGGFRHGSVCIPESRCGVAATE